MTAPAPPTIDPNYVPPYFDVFVAPFTDQETSAMLLPTNAADPRSEDFIYVGKVDGATLYGYGGLGKKNPFPNPWLDGSPVPPFNYATDYVVIYEGDDLMGGHVRACVKEVRYAKNATTGKVTGNAQLDEYYARAYWYYQPPAAQAEEESAPEVATEVAPQDSPTAPEEPTPAP